jgi:hypothetical protein
MSGRTMEPLQAGTAAWLRPTAMEAVEFEGVRERLEGLASGTLPEEVYAAQRRSIYVVDDEQLGRVAIKEMRYEGALRRLFLRYAGGGRGLREWRVGCEFEARGGRTPRLLGAAMQRSASSLSRVLVFLTWIDSAETLTEYLRRHGDPPPPGLLAPVADALIEAAGLGLVHGRHGSDNVLVEPGEEPAFYTIDFAYSHMARRLAVAAFRRDVARIAHWLWHERIYCDATIAALFRAVATRAWPREAERQARAMQEELARWKRLKPGKPSEACAPIPGA